MNAGRVLRVQLLSMKTTVTIPGYCMSRGKGALGWIRHETEMSQRRSVEPRMDGVADLAECLLPML